MIKQAHFMPTYKNSEHIWLYLLNAVRVLTSQEHPSVNLSGCKLLPLQLQERILLGKSSMAMLDMIPQILLKL